MGTSSSDTDETTTYCGLHGNSGRARKIYAFGIDLVFDTTLGLAFANHRKTPLSKDIKVASHPEISAFPVITFEQDRAVGCWLFPEP
jgi:hypothetical protein